MIIFLDLILVLLLIMLNAFFVLSEFSLVKVRSTRLEELSRHGSKKALLAKKAAHQIDDYLSAIQLGITMASLGLGWVGEPAVAKLFQSMMPSLAPSLSSALSHSVAFVCAFLIITAMHVTLGEQVPKLIAIRIPDRTAMWTAYPLYLFYKAAYLPMKLLNDMAQFVLRLLGFTQPEKEMVHSEEEMRMILAQSQEEGNISLGRFLMFENLFDFGHATVKEIMTPRQSIACLSVNKNWDENFSVIKQRRYSRYPLCAAGVDDATSYVLLKDLVLDSVPGQEPHLTGKRRELLFMQEGTPLEVAQREFQEKRRHMALVKNAEGKITGLITLENVLEELTGEIRDEAEIIAPVTLYNSFVFEAALLDLQETERFAAMKKLLASLHKAQPIFNQEEAWRLVEKRELTLSCALGNETAFPHARIMNLQRPLIVFGRAKTAVDFPSLDKKPVKLIFMILTPQNEASHQLRILSRLSMLVSNPALKQNLLKAENTQEFMEIIRAFEDKIPL